MGPTVNAGTYRAGVSMNVPNLDATTRELAVETESPPGHAATEDAAAICPVRVVATPDDGCRVIPRR
ncbi:MAG: hypothetical protein WCB18_04520 [Thermoplasmata archaeon]